MRVKALVTIRGTRSILFHRFSVDTAIPLERQERTGVAGNDPEEWKRTVPVTPEGDLYLDASYIFGCLRDAGKYLKAGKGSMQSKLAATLVVIEETILLDRKLPKGELLQDKTQPVYLDVRSVRNPNSKGRNIRYRVAASPGWKVSFTIDWDSTIVAEHQMKSILRDAGTLVGIGDGRSIGFGRFDIETVEMLP